MEFSVPQNFLRDRLESLVRITTEIEKEALMIDDEAPILELVASMTDVVPINNLEAEAFLVKIREISAGDSPEYMITCPECQAMNNLFITIDEFFDFDTPYQLNGIDMPIGLFTSIEEIINNTELENISIKDYNELETLILQQNSKIFKTYTTKPCRKCNRSLTVEIDPRVFFSKSTLADIYQDYINISMFTHNGKRDIDTLYPFEREIYNNIISDRMKDNS